jgi:DNA-binding IclR family transcriptional regulator
LDGLRHTEVMQSLEKASLILRYFNREKPVWGVRELANELEMPRSSTHLYLQTLANLQWLRRSEDGKYRLSWRLLEFSEQLHHSLGWYGAARLKMQNLATQTKTLGVLCVLEDNRVVCIDRFNADPALEFEHIQTDVYLPANATAAGKVLYAFQELNAPSFEAFTTNTITTPDEWQTELERVRKQQIAYSIEEWLPGQCALAIPVFFEGKLEATLGVQLPLKRYLLERQGLRKVLLGG